MVAVEVPGLVLEKTSEDLSPQAACPEQTVGPLSIVDEPIPFFAPSNAMAGTLGFGSCDPRDAPLQAYFARENWAAAKLRGATFKQFFAPGARTFMQESPWVAAAFVPLGQVAFGARALRWLREGVNAVTSFGKANQATSHVVQPGSGLGAKIAGVLGKGKPRLSPRAEGYRYFDHDLGDYHYKYTNLLSKLSTEGNTPEIEAELSDLLPRFFNRLHTFTREGAWTEIEEATIKDSLIEGILARSKDLEPVVNRAAKYAERRASDLAWLSEKWGPNYIDCIEREAHDIRDHFEARIWLDLTNQRRYRTSPSRFDDWLDGFNDHYQNVLRHLRSPSPASYQELKLEFRSLQKQAQALTGESLLRFWGSGVMHGLPQRNTWVWPRD